MLITDNDRMSKLANCLKVASNFLLNEDEALNLIKMQIKTIKEKWDLVCKEASFTEVDRKLLWRRQIMNPYIFEGLSGNAKKLVNML